MKIYLNENTLEITDNTDLQDVLSSELNILPEKKGIAVAVNDNIIPKEEWKKYILKANDRILVIVAAQGG